MRTFSYLYQVKFIVSSNRCSKQNLTKIHVVVKYNQYCDSVHRLDLENIKRDKRFAMMKKLLTESAIQYTKHYFIFKLCPLLLNDI